MRKIERASAFRKDFKRVKASPRHAGDIDVLLPTIVAMLIVATPLPQANRDHALGGDWRGYRDCHLKPDLLLIYRKPDPETLRLARLGSHSELFG